MRQRPNLDSKKPLPGGTPEAEAYAACVRKITHGVTVRQLEEKFSYGRQRWSEFRSGKRILPWLLFTDLVAEYIPRRQQQDALLHGKRLFNRAEQATLAKATLPEAEADAADKATPKELMVRLDEARKGQIEAERALSSMVSVIYVLMYMVASLKERCELLENQMPSADVAELQALRMELAETKASKHVAEEQLAQARREREEAEVIRAAAAVQAERSRRRLHQDQAQDGDHGPEPEPLSTGPLDDGGSLNVRPLYEYDAVLERTGEKLDEQQANLARLREQVGLDPVAEDPGIVHSTAADNVDKPATSGQGPTSWRRVVPDVRGRIVPSQVRREAPRQVEARKPRPPHRISPLSLWLGLAVMALRGLARRLRLREAFRWLSAPLVPVLWHWTDRKAGRFWRRSGLMLSWVPFTLSTFVVSALRTRHPQPPLVLVIVLAILWSVLGALASWRIIKKATLLSYIAHITYLDGGDPIPSLLIAFAPYLTVGLGALALFAQPAQLGVIGQIAQTLAWPPLGL